MAASTNQRTNGTLGTRLRAAWQSARIAATTRERYWLREARRTRRRASMSRAATGARRRLADYRSDVGTSIGLARRTALPAATGILLLVFLEMLGWLLTLTAPAPFSLLGAPLVPGEWSGLTGTLTGAIATFLALFYATVGVVASTVYQSAPGEVRALFVEERASSAYVRGVVRALLLGLALMFTAALGYAPRVLSLTVFALLCVYAIVLLSYLGRQLFNFFDPTALSKGLIAQFRRAARQASDPRTRSLAGPQHNARDRASRVVRLFGQLALLVAGRRVQDPRGPFQLARQMISMLVISATAKSAIPSTSHWWSSTQQHQNWLTLSYLDKLAADASAGALPTKVAPDFLWVERQLIRSFRDALSALLNSPKPMRAAEIADNSQTLATLLGSRLQVDEGLLFAEALSAAMSRLADPDNKSLELTSIDRAAVGERSLLPYAWLWDGFVRACQHAAQMDLRNLFSHQAFLDTAYASALPRPVLAEIERLNTAVRFEYESEGARSTPAWWLTHYVARTYTDSITHAHQAFIAAVCPSTSQQVQSLLAREEYDMAASVALTGFGLTTRVIRHQPRIADCLKELARFRTPLASNDAWPPAISTDAIKTEHRLLLTAMSKCLPHLRTKSHTETAPDLYGQLYQTLVTATFDAIVEDDADLASTLFGALLRDVDVIRARIRDDLPLHHEDVRLRASIEPVVTVAELSGYAMIFNEFSSSGMWSRFRAIWDPVLSAEQLHAAELVASSLDIASSPFGGLGPGTMTRQSRRQLLNHYLDERGIKRDRHSWPRRGATRPHESVIVSVMAMDGYSMHNVEDLFAVEYLRRFLAEGPEPTPAQESLIHSLKVLREARPPLAEPREETGPV